MAVSSLEGKAVIVTGAGSGLGQAMTLGLAAAGADVLALDVVKSRAAETARQAKEKVKKRSGKVVAHGCDVRSEEACAEAIETAKAKLGGLTGVVNCAGLGMNYLRPDFHARPLRFWEADPKRWQDIIDVNIRGPFLLARAAAPHLIAAKWGRIVNITTSFNTMMRGANMPYGQTKAALEAASAAWAQELEGSGVTVNVLVPGGAADTPMIPKETTYDRKKLVKPTVMVAPICWLMSGDSDGVTGRRFVGQLWDPKAAWDEASAKAGAPAAWPDLAAQAASTQATPRGGFKV